MNLFMSGDFALHSGRRRNWKIECDALTDADIETLATMASNFVLKFTHTFGVPRGGHRLAKAMERYAVPQNGGHELPLIVEDVLTTGASMEAIRQPIIARTELPWHVRGLVIFCCGPCPSWVTPLFRMPASRPA